MLEPPYINYQAWQQLARVEIWAIHWGATTVDRKKSNKSRWKTVRSFQKAKLLNTKQPGHKNKGGVFRNK